MNLLRKILIPLVPIYYIITWVRNYFYDREILKSISYDFPVVCVGNLSVGGTGKTPMIELLVRLLQKDYKIAILSRGYKRKSKGFHLASEHTTVDDIGDEPYQFFSKFKNVFVAVDSNRQNGIKLLQETVNPDIVLLDDAFQHRKVKAGFNILLTTYNNLFVNDMLLPAGNLREPKAGAKRANVIIITKCPDNLTKNKKHEIINLINPAPQQSVFFSKIKYSKKIKNFETSIDLQDLKETVFSLVTGIADASPLLNYLNKKGLKFEHLNFEDHHNFSTNEIELIRSKNMVVTTEKDFMRLGTREMKNLYYLPIEVELDKPEVFKKSLQSLLK